MRSSWRADPLDRAALEGDPFNKGMLPLLWEMFPDDPNLLPAFFEDDPNAASLGTSFVREPLFSREGANIALVREGLTRPSRTDPMALKASFVRPSAAAEFFQLISGARKRADRPCPLRPVDPRGRKPDHRQ